MKKLSASMETMIREAVFHEVRQDGEIVRSGYIVAGRTGTVVALIDRDLATPADAENLGLNWLTEDGEDVYRGMMNVVIDESRAAAGPDFGDDVARAIAGHDEQTFMSIETNELPGDAERIWDMENAAAERAGIDAENLAEWEAELAERAGIDRLIASLDAYVFTSKHIFVSKDLIHTTRRLRAEVRAKRAAKVASFAKLADSFDAICDTWDDAVSSGESTWQRAERVKRRLAASIRPTMGAKRKPSKPRR